MADVPLLRQGQTQPGLPGTTPTYQELVDRVGNLEKAINEGAIDLERIPLTDLMRKLEAIWQPEPSDLIGPGGVVGSRLATSAVTSRTAGQQVSGRVNFNANYNIANVGNPHAVFGNVYQIDVHPDDLDSCIAASNFVIPYDGLYLVYATVVALTGFANGLIEHYVLVNGGEIDRHSESWQGGQNQSQPIATVWPMAKGDIVSFQQSNFTATNPVTFWAGNFWGIHRLSAF